MHSEICTQGTLTHLSHFFDQASTAEHFSKPNLYLLNRSRTGGLMFDEQIEAAEQACMHLMCNLVVEL